MATAPEISTFLLPLDWTDWSKPDLIDLKTKVDEHTRGLRALRAEWSQKMPLEWGASVRTAIQKSGTNSQLVQTAIGRANTEMKGRNEVASRNLQDSDQFPDRRKAVFCMEVVRSLKERNRELYEDIKAEVLDAFDPTVER